MKGLGKALKKKKKSNLGQVNNVNNQLEKTDGQEFTGTAEMPSDKNIKKAKVNKGRVKKIQARKKQAEVRKNRRADRLAARKGFEGAGQYDDNESMMKARAEARGLMAKRKAGRKQYLRNFASQLAAGEQAGRPKEKYKGGYKEGDNFGQKGGSKEDVAETTQTNENVAQIKEKLNTSSNDNSLMNTYLGTTNLAQNEFNVGAEFDPLKINTNLTALNKGITTEDSTPQTAMMKLYNQKRGR